MSKMRVLAVAEQEQARRAGVRHLPAQLRPDRTAGAGHEHRRAGEVAGRILQPFLVGQVNTPEQIRDVDRARSRLTLTPPPSSS